VQLANREKSGVHACHLHSSLQILSSAGYAWMQDQIMERELLDFMLVELLRREKNTGMKHDEEP
jgi:hypothetical protein